MKSAGKARNNGLYRHIRTSKEIIRNLLNDLSNNKNRALDRLPIRIIYGLVKELSIKKDPNKKIGAI